ncbi:uncharacterized protein [Porites lutea]|uniref:uncharacterized protein n=1 Tax=Porites lutea TaxID=51062 RepID=UPI003CC608D6
MDALRAYFVNSFPLCPMTLCKLRQSLCACFNRCMARKKGVYFEVWLEDIGRIKRQSKQHRYPCSVAVIQPLDCKMAEKKTGPEASNGEDNSQLSQGQAHEEEDEQQNLQLVNRNNTLEDGNLFPLPGWTEKGQRVQQCTEENPPGGIDTETGNPQEHECLCQTCQST